jgi:hypothetical protein
MNWSKVGIVYNNGQNYQYFINFMHKQEYVTNPHKFRYCYANTVNTVTLTEEKSHLLLISGRDIKGK